MTGLIAGGSHLLLQVALAANDTIYTKQVAAEPGWFEKVTSLASAIMHRLRFLDAGGFVGVEKNVERVLPGTDCAGSLESRFHRF